MARVFDLTQIKKVVGDIDVVWAMEEGFAAYSEGKVVVPPVGELLFENPPGDAHIKYGYIIGDDVFVIKIATGFYENIKRGLPSGSGLMLVFSQKTGDIECILLDEGHLTNVRTAAAGAVAAKYLAPKKVRGIGVVGAGTQGRLQVEYLRPIVDCRRVWVWGQDDEELALYRTEMEQRGYEVHTTRETTEVARNCNLIITATPSKKPLLAAEDIQPGTHITAMGSDTTDKIELEPAILAKADRVVADSIEQSQSRGEIFKAIGAGQLRKEDVVELGNVIRDASLRRKSDDEITVADLTGVAVQDIQIAKAVYAALGR